LLEFYVVMAGVARKMEYNPHLKLYARDSFKLEFNEQVRLFKRIEKSSLTINSVIMKEVELERFLRSFLRRRNECLLRAGYKVDTVIVIPVEEFL